MWPQGPGPVRSRTSRDVTVGRKGWCRRGETPGALRPHAASAGVASWWPPHLLTPVDSESRRKPEQPLLILQNSKKKGM